MVSTKRGAIGKPVVTYSGYLTYSRVSKKTGLLNGQEMYDLILETQKFPNFGMTLPTWVDPENLNNTDWQDEVFCVA